MSQEIHNQIKQLIDKSKRILITTSQRFSGDGLSSCLALAHVLKKLNKQSEIIIEAFNVPAEFKFLPGVEVVNGEVKKLKKYLITLDISQTGLDELAYDIEEGNLRIHLAPKRGVFNANDLKFQTSEFSFDLIFIMGAQDLESLGSLYDNHRDLFYKIPVINIDNSPQNDNYGHLNLIDLTATSTTEIIYELIKNWSINLFDDKIATCLLTGMISATRSFKTENVSPKSLTVASELMRYGANRQEIINRLYQTKTIPTLKLWGKILTRLQSLPEKKLLWSKLDPHDFTETGASPLQIQGVVDELIAANPAVETIALFYQTDFNLTRVIIHSQGLKNSLNLVRKYLPSGNKDNAYFSLNKGLEQTETEVIEHLKTQL
jgi:nanoRNase/pAp phosphatase (c-di-AMP/oligoRNAs hydrolase)